MQAVKFNAFWRVYASISIRSLLLRGHCIPGHLPRSVAGCTVSYPGKQPNLPDFAPCRTLRAVARGDLHRCNCATFWSLEYPSYGNYIPAAQKSLPNQLQNMLSMKWRNPALLNETHVKIAIQV